MKLQEIVFHVPEQIEPELFYRRRNGETGPIEQTIKETQNQCVSFSAGEGIVFDTFFNAFSLAKWKRYTKNEKFSITIYGTGTFQYELISATCKEGLVCVPIDKGEIVLEEGTPVSIPIPETDATICYPNFTAVHDGCCLCSVCYEGDCEDLQDIRLAIDICTFKREPYVKRNIHNLRDEILNQPQSLLYGRTEVFVSDNANTLGDTFDGYSHVHVNPNENVGGVGGFTRGMIEAMEYDEKGFTHVLIMDDDAIILPSAVERTYTLLATLKEEYKEATIGGSLLRENTTHVQFESGATWDRGHIVAHHHHYDFKKLEDVVANEKEEVVEYTGWWYTAVPVSVIKEVGLPLPLFIHRDDIEYGIRAGQNRFILMNGIAVWHEAFENKMPGATEYYDLRNMAIINSIHYKDYSKKELKRFLKKWVLSNIVRYRYGYVYMNLLGVEDFCKGIDWLKKQDGQALHGTIMTMNYKAKPATEYVGYAGITEEDISWSHLEQVEERKVGKLEKLFKMATMNGGMLPAKGVKVARPHGNIYDLFRKKEILYVDAAGNGLLLKRDGNELRKCLSKLSQTLKIIDKDFETARKSYEERYQELITLDYWKRYLKMWEQET